MYKATKWNIETIDRSTLCRNNSHSFSSVMRVYLCVCVCLCAHSMTTTTFSRLYNSAILWILFHWHRTHYSVTKNERGLKSSFSFSSVNCCFYCLFIVHNVFFAHAFGKFDSRTDTIQKNNERRTERNRKKINNERKKNKALATNCCCRSGRCSRVVRYEMWLSRDCVQPKRFDKQKSDVGRTNKRAKWKIKQMNCENK